MKSALLVLFLVIKNESVESLIAYSRIYTNICLLKNILLSYDYGTYPPGEENQYLAQMPGTFETGTIFTVYFTSEAFLEVQGGNAVISKSQQKNTFIINVYKVSHYLHFRVKGPVNGSVPYITSVKVEGVEICSIPTVGILDDLVRDRRIATQVRSSLPVEDCGRRKVDVTELIVNGESTKRGDWPWHAAVYRLEGTTSSYICGGTLISKLYVLTAAHCATINNVPVVPDILNIVLGKHHFIGGDISSQERNVFSVTIHEDFGSPQHLDNDIALLTLMTEAVYNDYVQPACLWSSTTDYNPPTNTDVLGTVVGWGVSQRNNKTLSLQLKQASLPMVSEATCLKSNPIFYGKILGNDRKFCAGWKNGTSPCNGDSGGGFMVFVPDEGSDSTGAWYVRGIVSMAIPSAGTSVCDPEQYVIFTDVLKYEIWIWTRTGRDIPRGS